MNTPSSQESPPPSSSFLPSWEFVFKNLSIFALTVCALIPQSRHNDGDPVTPAREIEEFLRRQQAQDMEPPMQSDRLDVPDFGNLALPTEDAPADTGAAPALPSAHNGRVKEEAGKYPDVEYRPVTPYSRDSFDDIRLRAKRTHD